MSATDVALNRLDLAGLQRPDLRPGTIGPIARALGGASLPLFERYLIGKHTRGLATTPCPSRHDPAGHHASAQDLAAGPLTEQQKHQTGVERGQDKAHGLHVGFFQIKS